MTRLSGPRKERTSVIGTEEFNDMIQQTYENEDGRPEYYAIRDRAVLCIFRLTGKRVKEVATLKQSDLDIKAPNLSITFSVVKKRKKQSLTTRREKQIPLADPLVPPILEYREWMNKNVGDAVEWLFPRTHYSPSFETLTFDRTHLSTRQFLRIVQKYNPNIWCHLFRETAGADIVREDKTIMAVWKVKKRLDLEKTETAWRYMDRYGVDVINRKEE
jgi:Site-specific recombinase XerD